MKRKLLQIRTDEIFLSKLDYLQKINGLKTTADTVRKIVEKEFNKEMHYHWISVSKKKYPDKEGEYLVTDDAGGAATVDRDEFMICDDGSPCWLYSQNVTAWCELPKPYKGEKTNA